MLSGNQCLQHIFPRPACCAPREHLSDHQHSKKCLYSAAYDVLSSEETRNIYDRYGEEGVKQHAAQGSGGGGSPQDIFSQ